MHPTMPPMNPIASTTNRPFTQLSINLITDLPMNDGCDSILVIIDHGLSKGAIITPCTKTITAEKTAMIFIEKVFIRYGMYDKIISDRGPQFVSKFAKEVARLLEYKVALSTTYHPQTDGQTE
jgi:hypothetical protein